MCQHFIRVNSTTKRGTIFRTRAVLEETILYSIYSIYIVYITGKLTDKTQDLKNTLFLELVLLVVVRVQSQNG